MSGSQQVTADAEQVLDRPWTDAKRWSCPADWKPRICRSRCRVGSCETSARLLAYGSVRWTTEGITARQAAP